MSYDYYSYVCYYLSFFSINGYNLQVVRTLNFELAYLAFVRLRYIYVEKTKKDKYKLRQVIFLGSKKRKKDCLAIKQTKRSISQTGKGNFDVITKSLRQITFIIRYYHKVFFLSVQLYKLFLNSRHFFPRNVFMEIFTVSNIFHGRLFYLFLKTYFLEMFTLRYSFWGYFVAG